MRTASFTESDASHRNATFSLYPRFISTFSNVPPPLSTRGHSTNSFRVSFFAGQWIRRKTKRDQVHFFIGFISDGTVVGGICNERYLEFGREQALFDCRTTIGFQDEL